MRPPHYDSKPIYTDGAGMGWVGYGIFFEWPSACFQVFVWKEERMNRRPEKLCPVCGADITDTFDESDYYCEECDVLVEGGERAKEE